MSLLAESYVSKMPVTPPLLSGVVTFFVPDVLVCKNFASDDY